MLAKSARPAKIMADHQPPGDGPLQARPIEDARPEVPKGLVGERATRGTTRWLILGFLAGNLLLCLWVFRDALWGRSLMAPLDVLPAICSKYHFMDPASSGIPANQYIADQVAYDLPIQLVVYEAYRRGEIPWWDPYSFSGRPLLADAHINGTDPARLLCYLALPSFACAYNWTRVLQFVLGGLGMLVLLRYWRFPGPACVLLALTYEFAGSQVYWFEDPWVQASFNYYPLLWLVWEAGFGKPKWWHALAASLLAAGVFYSGNLQSDSYLVLFAAAFALGHAGKTWSLWKRVLPAIAVPGLIGAALAMPVLLGQLELFSQTPRPIGAPWRPINALSGLASLSAIYPWMLGTFRSLDLCKLFGDNLDGFQIFIGPAGFLLAALACWWRPLRAELQPAKRTALWLVAIYLVIVSTPLSGFLYSRSAGLGVLGLIVLAALGAESLVSRLVMSRSLGRSVVAAVMLVALATNVASLVIYPRFLPQVRQMVAAKSAKGIGLRRAYALREFQVNNLGAEVSFKNPETVAGCLSLLGVAGACLWPAVRRHRAAMPLLLAMNLAPLLMFGQRFIPVQSMALWRRLVESDSEQKRVAAVLNPGRQRLLELSCEPSEQLYPAALQHLFRARTVHGYASLWPRSYEALSAEEQARLLPQAADYIYETPTPGLSRGTFRKNPTPGLARFQWVGPSDRGLAVEAETLNHIRLSIQAGPESDLLWTDTYYPGWSAWAGPRRLAIQRTGPFFSRLRIPSGALTLVLRYEPAPLRLGIKLAGAALMVLVIGSAVARFRPQKTVLLTGG